MLKYILIVVAIVALGGISGIRYHYDQVNKATAQRAAHNACVLKNNAQQQKDNELIKATNGRYHGAPLPACR
jgi:hypothetical protein